MAALAPGTGNPPFRQRRRQRSVFLGDHLGSVDLSWPGRERSAWSRGGVKAGAFWQSALQSTSIEMEAVTTIENLDQIQATFAGALSDRRQIDGKSENEAKSLRMLPDRIRLKPRDLAGAEEEKMLDDFARTRYTRSWTRMNTAALVMAS